MRETPGRHPWRGALTLCGMAMLMACPATQAQTLAAPDTLDALRADFQDPPISARPKALWDWTNGNVSLSQITREMEEAWQMGMGGFDIWDVGVLVDPDSLVPAGPPFLSDESVAAIGHAVREGTRLGLELGLVISSSWNAGGTWVPPEHGAAGLFRSSADVEGPGHFDGRLPFPDLPTLYDNDERRPTIITRDSATGLPTHYRDVAVLAYPLRPDSAISDTARILNLTGQLGKGGRLRWDVPEGAWRITRYVSTGTGQPLMVPSTNSRGLMLDHFSAEAMTANLDYIIGRLEPEIGPFEETALDYLYTDSYEGNTAIWTPGLAEIFRQRNGYSLIPYLPVLDGFTVESPEVTDRFRYDFGKTLSDLIIENHYAHGREISHRHGLKFYAEAGGPGPPVHNVPFEDLKALGALDVPRGEFWNTHPYGEEHQNQLQIVKGPASAAHQYNQPSVEAEAFTSTWLWQEGPAEMKPLADRAFVEGLSRIVYHTFPHVPPEAGEPGWVYNFGTLVYPGRVWWPMSKPFHLYLGRTSFMLQQGHFVGDVLYYYGDRAPNFVTYEHPKPPSGYDFDVTNSDIIVSFGEWERNPRLQAKTLVGLRYATLPPDLALALRHQIPPGVDHQVPQTRPAWRYRPTSPRVDPAGMQTARRRNHQGPSLEGSRASAGLGAAAAFGLEADAAAQGQVELQALARVPKAPASVLGSSSVGARVLLCFDGQRDR